MAALVRALPGIGHWHAPKELQLVSCCQALIRHLEMAADLHCPSLKVFKINPE